MSSLYQQSPLLTFTFAFRVADVIVQGYQDFEHEVGERLAIPIELSVDELAGSEEKS